MEPLSAPHMGARAAFVGQHEGGDASAGDAGWQADAVDAHAPAGVGDNSDLYLSPLPIVLVRSHSQEVDLLFPFFVAFSLELTCGL